MSRNPIALAIPFFFLLIFIELLAARALRRRVHRLGDAFSDLGCGMTQQVVGTLYASALFSTFVWLHERAHLAQLEASPALWVFAIVAVDFMYYWWHRTSHRVNLLWGAHVVHHQSEDMNLVVALRQAPLTNFTILPFYAPLVLVLPPLVVAGSASLNTLYQFWIHTELVPKLGPIEWLFNTPSHHRAHHGVNPRYIDKNYAGILIIWDRLFGTFAEETEPVVYGTVEPLRSFNPLWAQIHPWVALARMARRAPAFADKLRLWFMPPEWAPAGVPAHVAPRAVTPETRPKWDTPLSRRLSWYVRFQLALCVVATSSLLYFRGELALGQAGLVSGAVLLTLLATAALLERRRWAWPLEVSRIAAIACVAAVALRGWP